ncbi:hypothetical protein FA95DRAFT_1596621 [Auriscalpium vulgare]|uniref:Uncharacterized protein n=1 Tax=Auriscalpium vulgare TaxID=40419 RepID=A0ACB8RQH5_9AGAM|nr:hypothetical protein FA95DRAFT_1596621 [Auriscalpium vulgare]
MCCPASVMLLGCLRSQKSKTMSYMALATTADLDAVDKYEFAQWLLEETGEFFPSTDEMKVDGTFDIHTLDDVEARIQALQTRHTKELEKLYARQAEQYHDEALDRYAAYDETPAYVKACADYMPSIKMTYSTSRGPGANTLEAKFLSEMNTLRSTQVGGLKPLFDVRADLRTQDNEARRRRDRAFPASVAEYRGITNRDISLRIAQFLAADAGKQEAMMTQFGWAHRQVQTLKDAYAADAKLKEDVQRRMSEATVTDPRRKTSGISLG